MSRPPDAYSISPVFGHVGDELQREVAAFWLDNGAISGADEAWRRTRELLCVARDEVGKVVGVNTAYVSSLPEGEDLYYFYRMFIRPQDRQLRLSCALMRAGVDTLRGCRDGQPAIRGAALVTENPKLMRASGRRVLTYLGWSQSGKDSRGQDVWTVEFEQGSVSGTRGCGGRPPHPRFP